MPSYQTTAIVLGRTNFGEADRIIRLLTAEHGKLSAVAKGVRRVKSKSGGHLEPFGEVNLMLASGRNLDVITSARLVWYPHELTSDFDRLQLAGAVATLADRLAPAGQPSPDLYELVHRSLSLINAGRTMVLVELWYKLRLLEISGLRPELDHCLVCGRSDSDTRYWFEAERGGLTCDDCRSATAASMEQSTIKLWRLMLERDFEVIDRIGGAGALAASSLPSCDDFYDYHAGHSARLANLG
jgi:DNA repair protein RecO (recombination protein O)